MKKIIIWIFFCLPIIGYSQEENKSNSQTETNLRPVHIGLSLGLQNSVFRDLATSPLNYKGMSNNLAISRQKTGTKKESECRFSFSSGSFIADFNTEIYASDVKSAEVLYSRLYQINKNSSNGINIKLGGMINVIGNLRINPGLQNNTLGFEVVPTGFGSVKIQKDLSRLTQKEGRFLFFNYLLSPRQKSLSCRINLGLINAAYRNGYVYTVQGDAINKPNPFSGHSLSLFSGFRLNTAIDYYIGLGNSNAIQLSYLWDGYSTGGDFEPFQMVSNTFRFTFLFSTNNQ